MTTKVEGGQGSVERMETGIYSLDYALSSPKKFGIPLRCIYELYGHTYVGKSTLAYFLAGTVANNNKISLCDLEGLDREYVTQCLDTIGFDGTLKLIEPVEKEKPRPHEEMLQEMVNDVLMSPDMCAGILDSVGAITPIMEMNGDFGEAFMGRRAKLVAQTVRRLLLMKQKKEPTVAFVINHVHSVLSGQGSVTAGGDTLKYLAFARINLRIRETLTASDEEKLPILYVIEGKVDKLKFGTRGRKFYCANIPGCGIDKNMSAVFECIMLGLAERSATVKINGQSVGRISKLIESAIEHDDAKFAPFYEVLDEYKRTGNPKGGDVEPEIGGDDPAV